MKQHLQAVWRFIIETLFPAFCLECHREGSFLCSDCFQQIPREDDKISTETGCFALDGVVSCCPYEEGALLARAIHALKYDFVEELAEPLGRLMVEAWPSAWCEVVLCPVPLHPKRQRWRGFNQAELLARVLAEGAEMKIGQFLERTSFRKPQMELSRTNRLQNVRNAFKVKASTEGISHVVLVDDVATTLATLEACAAALKEAGIPKVMAIVLARVH